MLAAAIVSVLRVLLGVVVDGREVGTLDGMDAAWGTFLRVLGREICNTKAVCRPIPPGVDVTDRATALRLTPALVSRGNWPNYSPREDNWSLTLGICSTLLGDQI